MDHTLSSPTTSVYKPGQLKLLSSVKQTMSKRIRQTFPQGFPTWNFHGTSRELTAGLPLRSQIPGKCDKSLEPMFKVLRVYTKGGWGGGWNLMDFGLGLSLDLLCLTISVWVGFTWPQSQVLPWQGQKSLSHGNSYGLRMLQHLIVFLHGTHVSTNEPYRPSGAIPSYGSRRASSIHGLMVPPVCGVPKIRRAFGARKTTIALNA